MRPEVAREGDLTLLRGHIICNDQLCQLALASHLHHFMVHPKDVELSKFGTWKPSCMSTVPCEATRAEAKWIADIFESVCGAYLAGLGEAGARLFLK